MYNALKMEVKGEYFPEILKLNFFFATTLLKE